MVVWKPAPWKTGVAPWRQERDPPTTYKPWKKGRGAKFKNSKAEQFQDQQYHVCPSCPKWCYHDKLKLQ
eukprot:186355-Heterocapsa_arctica.AAC.1